MKEYKIYKEGDLTIIESTNPALRASVGKDRKVKLDMDIALMEATVYKEDGVFVKDCNYLFELIDKNNKPTSDCSSIEDFYLLIDFFFNSVLGTEYFVKTIPRSSSLCSKDLKLFQFDIN
jgi:hypothetical protein